MALIPENPNGTAERIFQWYEDSVTDWRREHLGASTIGAACSRAVWYGWRWVRPKKFPGRVLRLFETGNLEEKRFAKELRAIGVEFYAVHPTTGKQVEFRHFGGHFGGSTDGIGKNLPEAPKTWHIFEFKTHNEKSFNELVSRGVAKSKPEHWCQMQIYMGLGGFTRAAYLATCKNDDRILCERVRFDKDAFNVLLQKAELVIFASEPPLRISTDPESWHCRYCTYKELCHASGTHHTLPENATPETNCRTCLHSTPQRDGAWRCDKHDALLKLPTQKSGCGQHRTIPALLPWDQVHYEADEAGLIESVSYVAGNGYTVTNDTPGHFPAHREESRKDNLPWETA